VVQALRARRIILALDMGLGKTLIGEAGKLQHSVSTLYLTTLPALASLVPLQDASSHVRTTGPYRTVGS